MEKKNLKLFLQKSGKEVTKPILFLKWEEVVKNASNRIEIAISH
jgi:hypothetical protein